MTKRGKKPEVDEELTAQIERVYDEAKARIERERGLTTLPERDCEELKAQITREKRLAAGFDRVVMEVLTGEPMEWAIIAMVRWCGCELIRHLALTPVGQREHDLRHHRSVLDALDDADTGLDWDSFLEGVYPPPRSEDFEAAMREIFAQAWNTYAPER